MLLIWGNSRWRHYRPPTRIEKRQEAEIKKRPDILPVIMHLQHSQIYELDSVEESNDTL